MFGAKAEAPATVVDVEQHGRGMSQGELKYRFGSRGAAARLAAVPADG
jgi:hypothetical protein